MFSNGTEYEVFMANNCYECRRYVHWEDETKSRKVCKIEERIALGDSTLPDEFFKRDTNTLNYSCIKFRDKNDPSNIKHRPKKIPKTQEEADGLLSNFR